MAIFARLCMLMTPPFRIMFEDFEMITVIAIQAVPCSEPNKHLVVLNDIRNPNLRKALGEEAFSIIADEKRVISMDLVVTALNFER
jgi:hypothetical protein